MGPDHTTTGDLVQVVLEAHGREVRMLVDPEDHIGRQLAAGHFYERDLLEDMKARVAPGVAIDVGAHIGNHTVWMGAICGLEVVALEPNPASYELLVENVRANELGCWLINAAAGAMAGKGEITHTQEGNSGMTTVEPGEGRVDITTIDDLECKDVSVLKIDVENQELDVLVGALRTIEEHRPVVYVEASSRARRESVDDLLGRFGYQRFGVFAKTPTHGYAA